MIAAESFIAAAVHAGETRLIDAAGVPAVGIARVAGRRWIQQETGSALVEVVQRVQVNAARTDVGNRPDDALSKEVVFQSGVPLFAVGRFQIVVQHARRTGDDKPSARIGQGVKLVGRNGNGVAIRYDSVVRRILDGVEHRVAEIAVVVDAVTGAKDGPAVTEEVIGKADPRPPVFKIWFVELVGPTEARPLNLGNKRRIGIRCANRVQIEISVKEALIIGAVENAKVLVAQASGDGQLARDLEAILTVE